MGKENKHWVESKFERCGAILDGHFVLTSGRHSWKYLDKTMICPNGERVAEICFAIAGEIAKVFTEWSKKRIEVVVGPAMGGIILSHEVAKSLSEFYGREVSSVFTEKDDHDNQIFKRPAFKKIVAGRLVLIVDDILTTGGSVNEVIRAVQEAGGRVMAVAVICNRGDVKSSDIMDYPLFCLWETTIESWLPKVCPLCQKGIPITNIK